MDCYDWTFGSVGFGLIVLVFWLGWRLLTHDLPGLLTSFGQVAQEDPEAAKQILEVGGAFLQILSPELGNKINQYHRQANEQETARLEAERLRIEVEKLRTELRERNLEVDEREDHKNRPGPGIYTED